MRIIVVNILPEQTFREIQLTHYTTLSRLTDREIKYIPDVEYGYTLSYISYISSFKRN